MPITEIQNTGIATGTASPSTTISLTGIVAHHLLLLPVITFNNAAETVAITDTQSNVWLQAGGFFSTSLASGVMSLWYVPDSKAGNTTATITASGGSLFYSAAFLEYSGADLVSPLDSSAVTTGNNTAADSGSCVVSNANSLLFSFVCQVTNSTSSLAAGSGFTARYMNNTAAIPIGTEDQIVSVATDGTFTFGGVVRWGCMAASFKPAAAAPVVYQPKSKNIVFLDEDDSYAGAADSICVGSLKFDPRLLRSRYAA